MTTKPTASLTRGAEVFERNALEYDHWFDLDKGQALFALELACLKSIKQNLAGLWLEVGVGSGRFAQALAIQHGIDPSSAMVKLAQGRGIDAQVAYGESLPCPASTFDGVLMVCTICFVENAAKVLKECARVLKPDGHLLIGFLPTDSIWGQFHSLRGKTGHDYYGSAKFFTQAELEALAADAGLGLKLATGCELPPPKASEDELPPNMQPTAGVDSFRCLLFHKR